MSGTNNNSNTDTTVPSIREQLAKFEQDVSWFQNDEFDLETAIEHFKMVSAEADTIEHTLKEMKNEISILSKRFDE